MVERNVLTSPGQGNLTENPVDASLSPSQDAQGEGGSIPGAPAPQSHWAAQWDE